MGRKRIKICTCYWCCICCLIALLPSISYGGTVTYNEVTSIMIAHNCLPVVARKTYVTLDPYDIRLFLVDDKTDELVYNYYTFNCVDFSNLLIKNIKEEYEGAAVGLLLIPSWWHAIVFFINDRNDMCCIDPYDDMISCYDGKFLNTFKQTIGVLK